VRAEATKHVLPGPKSLSCPVAVCTAVGTTWEASKLGGLNIKKCLQSRNDFRGKVVSRVEAGSQSSVAQGKADDTDEETGTSSLWDRRGMGPGIRGKILRDNVGIIPVAAGAGSNLRRLHERGRKAEVEESHAGLTNESVGARTEE
jgi:hypothetical protein